MAILEVAPGETWRMKRTHPCGSADWLVYRVGADIGIECIGCKRRVMLERRRFESRSKERLAPAHE